MRITQGTFSFLEDLTDEEIEAQIRYALQNGWAIMVEYTDDPHPRNSYWDMWNQPEFDLTPDESDVAMRDVHACRAGVSRTTTSRWSATTARSDARLRGSASSSTGRPQEPGFRLERQDKADRQMRYTIHPYATQDPVGRSLRQPGRPREYARPSGGSERHSGPGLAIRRLGKQRHRRRA